jgi:hypothetical protein
MTEESTFLCPRCAADVEPDSDFCPRCGSLFVDGAACLGHPSTAAIGVCAICSSPICAECGKLSGSTFLCNPHSSYEIYQGLARIYGSIDPVHAEFLQSCLEQERLHPFVYSRKASPIHIGGPEYTGFMSSGDSPRVIVNEFKLLVPCGEVLEAEALLKELDAHVGPTPDSL